MNHPIQIIVQHANPACNRCHGRGIFWQTWSENMSPLGSGMYWPQTFYEEDLCNCIEGFVGQWKAKMIGEQFSYWLEMDDEYPPEHKILGDYEEHDLSWAKAAHWGCKMCKLNVLEEHHADDHMAAGQIVGELLRDVHNLTVNDIEKRLEDAYSWIS